MAMFTTNLKVKDTNRYFDSGATIHVTSNANKFTRVKEMLDGKSVKSIVGHKHLVHGKGRNIISHNGAIKTMNNVIYVLRVSKNLLFVGAITNMGYMVMFGITKCWIISTKSLHKLIVNGRRDPTNGLYKLTMEVILNTPTGKIDALLFTTGGKDIDLWHQRMRHIGF